MMRAVVVGLALALAACAGPQGESAVSKSLPAPEAGVVAVKINAADAGKTITAPVGARISVSLVGVPTAGYLWSPTQTPAFLAKVDETGGPTHEAQRQPGFTGGSHWEVFVFEARAKGEGDLVLEQRRPWETTEPASDRFAVTIRVE